jgi:hypothetical protein
MDGDQTTQAPPATQGLDISSLSQPGAAAPSAAPPAAGVPAQLQSQILTDAQKVRDAQAQSVAPPPPGPHSTLLRMIEGLGAGLSAASTSLATRGKEGGAPEVQQYYEQKQAMAQSAQAARQQAHNANVENAIKTLQTDQLVGQTYHLFSMMPNELEASNLAIQAKKQEIATGAQSANINLADFVTSHMGFRPEQIAPPTAAGTASTPVAPAQMDFARRQLTQLTGPNSEASTVLAPDDPTLAAVKAVLAKPPSAQPTSQDAQDIFNAGSALSMAVNQRKAANKDKAEINTDQTNDPVAKLTTAEALAAPGAQAAIQAKINDPTTSASDRVRLVQALPQAAVAQLNAENIKAREARNTQIISQGDPANAGQLLASRVLTLDELKSRQVTPQFIAAAVEAAQKIDPNFKAPEAAAQARIAAAPANAQFFGNTDSLLVKGGTLDQLAQAHAALGNTKLPFANKLENWRKAQLGQGPQAAFAANALGVADDYSKVISGGQGSDSSRQQALDIIGRDLSPEGMAAAIAQIRGTIESQRNGRISTNPYLKSMYPDPVTRQEVPGVAGTQPAAPAGASNEVYVGGKLVGHTVGNRYIPLGQ